MVFQITYTVKDAKNLDAVMAFYIPESFGLPMAQQFAEDFGVLLAAYMTGVITACHLSIPMDISTWGLGATPAPESDVEEGALFVFRTAGGFTSKFRLPCLNESILAPGSANVDTEGPAGIIIAALVDGLEVTVGETTTDIFPCDYREDDLVALSSARENFRPRKKYDD